jgi:hypothetical protein
MTDWPTIDALAKVAREAPHALRLATQLFGVPACERCDYVKQHCRCLPTPQEHRSEKP